MLDYKKLSEVLKYSHDDFHNLLSQMNYHDFAGDEHADHTKRGVLADAYEEATDDTQGANHLRSGKPVAYYNNMIVPGHVKKIVLYHPDWDTTNTTGFTPQQLMDRADVWRHGEKQVRRSIHNPPIKLYPGCVKDNKNRGMFLSPTGYVHQQIVVPEEYSNGSEYNIHTGELTHANI